MESTERHPIRHRARPEPAEVRLVVVLLAGLGATVVGIGDVPERGAWLSAATLLAAAVVVHLDARRGRRTALLLNDAGADIARNAADASNTTRALLRGADRTLGAGHYWLLVRDDAAAALAWDGEDAVRVPTTPLDELLLAQTSRDQPLQWCRGRGPFDRFLVDVVAVRLPSVDDSTVLLCAGRRNPLNWFSYHQVDLLWRLAEHASLAMGQRRTVDQLQAESRTNRRAAALDQLTGLVNRHQFRELLGRAIESRAMPAVMLIDLDRFKQVNDTMGHHVGDLLLAEVATRMRTTLSDRALLARLGGDEFAVMLPGGTDEAELVAAAHRLRDALGAPMTLEGAPVEVGASLGIAMCGWGHDDPSDLLRRADVAMYQAKGERTGVELYRNALDHASTERMELLPALRGAIAEGRLDLHYQPQMVLQSGGVLGVEGLIRWTTPTGRHVAARETIAIAEQTDLIGPLTHWVLDRALADCRRWSNAVAPVRVSVNLSGRNVVEGNLAASIADALSRHGLPGAALRVELTESALAQHRESIVAALDAVRSLGVGVSLDDFGTGSSSLAHLAGLPVDELKIDESFVKDLGTSERADRVIRAIVELGTNLGLDVIAEGIETSRQASILTAMGCAGGQGYYFGRPMPVDAWSDWLWERAHRSRTSATRSSSERSAVVGTS